MIRGTYLKPRGTIYKGEREGERGVTETRCRLLTAEPRGGH